MICQHVLLLIYGLVQIFNNSQVLQRFCHMAGEPERSIKCDIMTCDSEMDTAHKNYALLHYMKSMEVRIIVPSNL